MTIMKKTAWAVMLAIAGAMLFAVPGAAAFNEEVEKAYNTAVQGQDALDGLDVSVKESTVSSRSNIRSDKTVDLMVSGIKNTALSADITVKADETDAQSYYRNGYYYETTKDGDIRSEMDRDTIWKKINSNIYLDMTSNYLKLLFAQSEGDETMFYFAATEETLGDYKTKLLDAYSDEHGAVIDSLHGSMRVDKEGHVTERMIQMVYTVGSGEETETFMKQADAVFNQSGEIKVTLPDLSGYKTTAEEKPAVTITPKTGTVYATADVNVRSLGSLDAAVIGGFSAGDGITQTGYTSDGWVQVQYNQETGYVWGEYISNTKPVFTKDGSGTMYATAEVNVRSTWSTEGDILGTLKKGEAIQITGVTSNGWTRVKYKQNRGYVSSNYLSWSEPVTEQFVKKASVSGTVVDASYGTLTIRRSDGVNVLFNTTYAAMRLKDTLDSGDWVTVGYTGSGTPYTATEVIDDTYHGSPQKTMFTMDGVVTAYSGSSMTMTCSDGVVRTFSLGGASMEVQGGIGPGAYLMVTWLSADGSETRNIPAIAVS